MNISSTMSASLAARVSAPTPGDGASQVQAQAQVSVLKKADQAQADMVSALMSGIGTKLDVRA